MRVLPVSGLARGEGIDGIAPAYRGQAPGGGDRHPPRWRSWVAILLLAGATLAGADVAAQELQPVAPAAADAVPGTPPASDWRRFAAEGFAIDLPAAPDVGELPMQVPGVVSVRNYTVDFGGSGYRVTVYRADPAGGTTALDAAMNFATSVFTESCTLVSESEVTSPAGPVKDITSTCNGQIYRARFIRGADRVYQPAAGGADGFEATADSNRFFDSFAFQPTEWKVLEATPDAFQIEFPTTPIIRENAFNPDLLVSLPTYLAYHDTGLFRVTVIHYRPELRAPMSDDEIFEVAFATVSSRCQVGADRALESPFGPARERTAVCPSGNGFKIHHHVIGDRLFEVVAAGSPEFIESSDAERFLASFRPLAQ